MIGSDGTRSVLDRRASARAASSLQWVSRSFIRHSGEQCGSIHHVRCTEPRPFEAGDRSGALPWVGMGLCLAAFLRYLAYDRLLGKPAELWPKRGVVAIAGARTTQAKSAQHQPGKRPPSRSTTTKFAVAKIKLEKVRVDQIATGVSVVGQIQANSDSRSRCVPAPRASFARSRLGSGQKVKQGDPLVILDSPEIGTARLNLRSKQRELSTARFEANWKSEIAANVALLIPELKKGISERRSAASDDDEHVETPPRQPTKRRVRSSSTDARVIEKKFAGKQLGTYRGTLLQAYAEFDIASHEEQKQAYLRSKDIVGEHPALVARHNREGIQAKLEAAIEQVQFDAAQEQRLAVQGVRLAEAAVIDAGQRLRILGVAEDIQSLLDHADLANTIARDEDVTFYRIVAAFRRHDHQEVRRLQPEGRSERRSFRCGRPALGVGHRQCHRVRRRQAAQDQGWLVPHERNRLSGPRILGAAAFGRRNRRPQTRTLPVLAQAENTDDLFKLGMFVRIHLDSSASRVGPDGAGRGRGRDRGPERRLRSRQERHRESVVFAAARRSSAPRPATAWW